MKYITLGGKKYHLVTTIKGREHVYGIGTAYCGKWAASGIDNDMIHTKVPRGSLCKACKKNYLKTHTEEELFLEII